MPHGRAEVEGREFICIDTGGIDGTEEGVETRMAEQSLLAIEEDRTYGHESAPGNPQPAHHECASGG
jgi:hypothetical protein